MAISYWVFPSLTKRQYKANQETINFYVSKVCAKMGVNPQVVKNRVRTERMAFARHYIAYFLYNNTTLCLSEVADAIGRKDHTTIRNCLKVCNKVLDVRNGYKFRNEFIELIDELSSTAPRIPRRQRKQIQ